MRGPGKIMLKRLTLTGLFATCGLFLVEPAGALIPLGQRPLVSSLHFGVHPLKPARSV
jgi:hypothetical protein